MSGLKWSGKTRGGYWGNRIFFALLGVGIIPAYALLVFVSLFFMVFRRHLCRGGAVYLERVFGVKIGTFSIKLYRLMFSFGMSLIDRAAFFSGNKKIILDSGESDFQIRRALAENKGAVLLTAHVGGWQIAASSLTKFGGKVSVMGVDKEEENISKMFSSREKLAKPAFLDAENGGYIKAFNALKRGEIVALHADRLLSGRFEEIEFFGAKVRFPTFAYSLAEMSGSPVVQIICVRTSLFRYKTFAYRIGDTQSLSAAGAFAENLENALRRYPYQWFNFFDFWSQ